jgi:RNA polymerase sigma factor for flagellar operon FliA
VSDASDDGAPANDGGAAYEALVREGMPLVVTAAKRVARKLGGRVPLDDLISIGNTALLDVARSWDPARAPYAAYATWKLGLAILDGARRETHGRWVKARATALVGAERFGGEYHAHHAGSRPPDDAPPTTMEQDQAALGEMLAGRAAALALGLIGGGLDEQVVHTPEERLARAEEEHLARAAIARLPERERALLERHYFGGEQFDEIAEDLGITKSWASRLHHRGVAAVQRELGGAHAFDEAPTLVDDR